MDNKITSIEDLLLVILVILMIGISLVLIFVILQTNNATRRLIAQKTGQEYEEFDFGKWWKKINGTTVSVTDEKSIMLHHDYDGIKELDNHLPPWWVNMFYLTIVFAIVYMLVYHVWDKAPLPAEEYELAMEKARKEVEAFQQQQGNSIDEKSVQLTPGDAGALANGKTIFESNCAACHGASGEGTVGPNLTDEYWLHGGSINDVFKTIKYGVPEKGMISWQSTIKPKDMQDVANYILSLQGSKPANGKAPEGEKHVAETVAAADSAAVQ
ncbi:cbb3-type cytochrome c oxidase N-terminal domain-containing protein [Leadbetterella sp. DM7]|uniref:cbb3-type cytochrome c oxidase N-terminal domain-containing protein n=1 Tax=Leadbetterella sp. DM7 TaxID=3235085 RepID=UPI00349E994F